MYKALKLWVPNYTYRISNKSDQRVILHNFRRNIRKIVYAINIYMFGWMSYTSHDLKPFGVSKNLAPLSFDQEVDLQILWKCQELDRKNKREEDCMELIGFTLIHWNKP